jgi:starch synthase
MGWEYGEGLDSILRSASDKFTGVLNGLDLEKFDPMKDPALKANYRYSSKKKTENKHALQEELNLEVSDLPMLGFVSRLVDQKGVDLIVSVIHEMLNQDMQVVILGTGDKRYEEMLLRTSREYPGKFRMIADFDEGLAQRIYASSDMILMPSRFEPCGLTQMIAMRYASIPIVRATGGLRDTVMDYESDPASSNGFVFEQYNGYAMLETIKRGIRLYQDQKEWQELVKRACKSVPTWKDSAQAYVEIYNRTREGYEE